MNCRWHIDPVPASCAQTVPLHCSIINVKCRVIICHVMKGVMKGATSKAVQWNGAGNSELELMLAISSEGGGIRTTVLL